jgi:hypothetical protein
MLGLAFSRKMSPALANFAGKATLITTTAAATIVGRIRMLD